MSLDSTLEQLQQRTGGTTSLETQSNRQLFLEQVQADISSVMNQLNAAHYVLATELVSESGLDALDYGLVGNIMLTHADATQNSAAVFWNSSKSRPRTIKETVDALLSEFTELENAFDSVMSVTAYDDTALTNSVNTNTTNLQQLKKDAFGTNYTLDGDGQADLTYPLAQALDAIGAFFTNYSPTGLTYGSSYPSLSLAVAQGDVTNLVSHLSNIRTFVGMDSAGDTTPDYSTHGGVTHVSDGQTLEQAIQALDAAVVANDSDISALQGEQSTQFIFVPGGTAGGNRYTSWSNLWADASAEAAKVQVEIVFDDTFSTPTIPSGSYTGIDYLSMKGIGVRDNHSNIDTVTEVTINSGATFTCDTVYLESLYVDYGGTSTIFDLTGATGNTMFALEDTIIIANGNTGPVVNWDGVNNLTCFFVNSQIDSVGSGVAIDGNTTTGTITVALAMGSSIGDDGIYNGDASATFTINFDSSSTPSTTQTNWSGSTTYSALSDADKVEYDNATSGLVATDVKAALDEITGDAATITYDNTTSGLTATDVQAAIDEVEGRVDSAEDDINDIAIEVYRQILSSNFTNSNEASLDTVFSEFAKQDLADSSYYKYKICLRVEVSATGTDLKMRMNPTLGSVGADVIFTGSEYAMNIVPSTGNFFSHSEDIVVDFSKASDIYFLVIEGILETFTGGPHNMDFVAARNGTSGTVTIYQGSYIEVERIGNALI